MSTFSNIINPLIDAGSAAKAIIIKVAGAFAQTDASVTTAHASAAKAFENGIGKQQPPALDDMLATLHNAQADALVTSLIEFWSPAQGKPSTADMLEAQGLYAVASFSEHGARVASFWSDPALRAVLVARAALLGVTVTPDLVTGLPVFTMGGQPLIKPYTEENGLIKLSA